jgi:outer membrane protein OmpA-like peptidoglycan-associated protein
MRLKISTIFFWLCLFTSITQAQKRSAFGIGFTTLDFETAAAIKAGSLSEALDNNEWWKLGNKTFGFNLNYLQGLTNHIDLGVQYTGAFVDYPYENIDIRSGKSSTLFSQLDLALNAYLLDASKTINPFLTAGVGGFYARKDFGAIAPLGVGIMFNLDDQTYIIPTAQYRIGLSDNATNHLQYSISFFQPLSKPKAPVATLPVITPPAPEAPKDSDNDGTSDDKDACPTQAGPASLNGCPDKDNDNISDKDDKCPDVRGLVKYNGCPIPDSDKDGVNDEEDKCPNQAGVARYAGCPIPDTDGDGVNDEADRCPRVAGQANNGGCPVLEQYNFNYKNVQFASGSATLTAGAKLELDKLVAILTEHPELKISIEGHTDNTGKVEMNQKLSENRAISVKNYLTGKGISADRLSTVGYGPAQPIADNSSTAGRAQNRRVEFKASE